MLDQREFYALSDGEPPRLSISWGFFRPDVIVYLDEQELGRIPRRKLREPHEFQLKDGSCLRIQQVFGLRILGVGFEPYFRISRDGEALPGLVSTPAQRLNAAKGWIWAIALLKLMQAIFAPSKTVALPLSWGLRDFVEWYQSFSGYIAIAILLFVIHALLKPFPQHTKTLFTLALTLILINFLTELLCVFFCQTSHSGYLAAIEGLASLSIYQAINVTDRQ
ncbi:MAG TPA: hypothetical protein V6C78_28250 [Crinalium sp.]|jgi:hypothetical protein